MKFSLTQQNTLRNILMALCVSALFASLPLAASAQFNPEINYQGKLTNASGVAVPDGLYNINFWLVPTLGGATSTAVWSEARTSGNRVQVTNGLFSVMLGDVSSLGSVDFNQTLYLGVEIGGISTTTPAWDGEMSPRKILGAVPTAFVANFATSAGFASSSLSVGGVASSSFLRSDEADTMTASSSSSLLTLVQNGVGKVLALFSGATEIFTALSNGNIGIGTTTPYSILTLGDSTSATGGIALGSDVGLYRSAASQFSVSLGGAERMRWALNGGVGQFQMVGAGTAAAPKYSWTGDTSTGMYMEGSGLGFATAGTNRITITNAGRVGIGTTTPGSSLSVVGDFRLTGSLRDSLNASGTVGQILSSTGAGTSWVATSSLGLGNGTYLGLSDTQSSFTANRIIFTNSGASALTDSANFTFDGTNLGLGGNSGITVGGDMVFLASTTRSNYMIGYEAGFTLDSSSDGNTFLGHSSGFRYSGDNSVLLGRAAGYGLGGIYTANEVVAVGNSAGINLSNGADNNVLIGSFAGEGVTTGANNTILGHRAADNLTTGSSNIVIGYDIDVASTTRSNQLNIGNLIFGTGLDGTGTTLASGNVGIGTTSPSAKLDVWGGLIVGTSSVPILYALPEYGIAGIRSTKFDDTLNIGNGGVSASDNASIGLYAPIDTSAAQTFGDEEKIFSVSSQSEGGGYYQGGAVVRGMSADTGVTGLNLYGYQRNSGTVTTPTVVISGQKWNGASATAALTGTDLVLGIGTSTSNPTIATFMANGNVGIGTSTQASRLTVAGDFRLTGALRDGANASGTLGMVLQSTGTSTRWVATSTLGITGASTFLALTDTPSSYTANRIMYTNSGATALIDSADLTFDGTNLGLGSEDGIAFNGVRYFTASSSGAISIGQGAGAAAVSNVNNIAIGFEAARNASFTQNNIAIGRIAGRNASSVRNVMIGDSAGATSTGTDNNIIGTGAGELQTGSDNNIFGRIAGINNSGSFNNLLGYQAGANQTGSYNNSFGNQAGNGNTGSSTNSFGNQAGFSNDGDFANLIGQNAGRDNQGDYVNLFGFEAGATSTGNYNNFIGYRAGADNTGIENNFMGYQAGRFNTGTNNNIFGNNAGYLNTGAYNNLFGVAAGEENDGDSVNLFGYRAGQFNSQDDLNSFGYESGRFNTGLYNNFMGAFAGSQNAGHGVNAFGLRAGTFNTGSSTNLFGSYAGYVNSGDYVDAIGALSGYVNSGYYTSLIGYGAGYSNAGDYTIALGYQALGTTTASSTGDRNLAFGARALFNNTTGANNIALGYQAGDNLRTGSNNIVIGYDIDATSATAANTLNIGNLIFGTGLTATGTTVSTGNIGIGTTTPASKLTVAGDFRLTDALRDGSNASGTLGMVLQSTGTSTRWVATSTLGITGGGGSLFTDAGATTYLTATGDNLAIGTTTAGSKLTVAGDLRVVGGINFGAETVIAQVGGNLQFGSYSLANAANSGVYSNTALGDSAGNALTSGFSNVFVGFGAGTLVATGSRSVIIGNEALGNGYGTLNAGAMVVIGDRAGFNLSSGDNNMFVGFRAGYSLTSGTNNTLIGYEAGYNLTSGSNNLVLGHDVDLASSTGSNQLNIGNLIFGTGVDGTGTTLSSGNVGIGTSAPTSKLSVAGSISVTNNVHLQSTTAGGTAGVVTIAGERYIHGYTLDNTYGVNQFMGYQSGNFTSGSSTNQFLGIDNLGIGRATLSALTEGSGNVAVGQAAMANTTTGGGNVAVGVSALGSNTTGGANIAIGQYALLNNISGRFNTVLGNAAMENNISGENNIAIGAYALQNSTTSNNNIAIGRQAGTSVTTGESNTIIGMFSGDGITTGGQNTIIGSNITGLASNLSNNIILADGDGNQRINVLSNGNTGIGTTSPSAKLDVWGNFQVGTSSASILYANSAVRQVVVGTSSYVDEPDNGSTPLMALVNNFSVDNPTMLLIRETAVDQYQSGMIKFEKTQNFGDGTVGVISFHNAGMISADTDVGDSVAGSLRFATDAPGAGTATIERMRLTSTGNLGLGTTTPLGRLGMENLNFSSTSTVAGIDQYFSFNNSVANASLYGNRTYLHATNTATTTIIGSITRVADSTTFGNTVRGLEVQADNGNNTRGENTGIAGFGRTFGVRGTTVGDAGGTFEPAGIYGETEGTTQGNAIRGYSSSITTAALLKLFQDTSTFTGTGLLMNFGNAGGSFSSTTASRFIDLQNAGSSRFTVGAYGMTTIGNGGTVNNAGLQIGYGGLCVDNDGSCNASTTGRISAVSYHTGNSDLAETYFSSDDLKTGEVVYLKGELSIGRASEATEKNIIGVVTTKPGLLLGFDDTSLRAGEEVYGVALAGRVPVRLSNENGEIKAGDELMLSSIPGVAMKASSTGTVVGIALEDFEEGRAYSDTYINQFGDDLVDPVVTPINPNNDPRVNDGCYYGAGSASGDAPCVPLVSTTTDAQVAEAQALAEAEAQAAALEALKYVRSETETLENGETVRVGQIVMFVSLDKRYLDEDGIAMVAALLASGEGADVDAEVADTVWSRLVTIANNFVDGVLSVLTLKADRVEVTEELCVDGVCLNADDIRQLLDGTTAPTTPEPEEEPEDEASEEEEGGELPPPPTEESEGETGTSTDDGTGEESGTEESPIEEENIEPEEEPEEEVEENEPEEESGASTPDESSDEPTI